ncbi:hypothetical protein A3L09_07575 [Thermococcus profundus]|uniref:Uncharacterized protein n=2 Tax=Thermococcus profundus TaxID=49899 RepID=A0A2Z2ML18_THEPR|nr:hypothetical protein A3L09_07575 [Thermococcus profundus]
MEVGNKVVVDAPKTVLKKIDMYRRFMEKFSTLLGDEAGSEVAKFVAFGEALPARFNIIVEGMEFTVDRSALSVREGLTDGLPLFKIEGDTVLFLIDDDEVGDIDIVPRELIIRDFSFYFNGVELFEARLKFTGLFFNGKPVVEFLTLTSPLVLKQVVFYTGDDRKFKIGFVEDVTDVEATIGDTDVLVVGVPVIGRKPYIGFLIPARVFGLPSRDIELALSSLKLKLKALEEDYLDIETLVTMAIDEWELMRMTRELGLEDLIRANENRLRKMLEAITWKIATDIFDLDSGHSVGYPIDEAYWGGE